ncbi:MAG: TlpA family protein disulfide reductase [Phycisphaerales bacterium]|nr:TlpA family protein disulfide reductase [Phycisphaerales bacterium]
MVTRHRTTAFAVLSGLLALAMVAPMLAALAGPGDTKADREFGDRFYFYKANDPKRAAHMAMEGKPAPKLTIAQWSGTPGADLESLKGKVVVVDFWATWCPPCRKAIPKNIQLVKKYDAKDFALIAVHDSANGWDKVSDMIRAQGMNYPVGLDKNGASTKAWNVKFWPTYAVIDRAGIVRAIGLRPENVAEVVAKVMKDKATTTPEAGDAPEAPTAPAAPDLAPARAAQPVSRGWLEGSPDKRARLSNLGSTPPALAQATNWMNGDAMSLESLKGKVVVLDFWATWCGPCKRAIPHMNELVERYGSEGLVVIGVCHPREHEAMGDVVRDLGIRYPVCADAKGVINAAYKVDGYPDYYVIDRSGTLRVADCANGRVEEVIQALLAE